MALSLPLVTLGIFFVGSLLQSPLTYLDQKSSVPQLDIYNRDTTHHLEACDLKLDFLILYDFQ